MAEEERSDGSCPFFSEKRWGHTEHIAALILQRAFLRSRLRRATAERLRSEDIAKRLAQAEMDFLRRSASLRQYQLKVQLPVRLGHAPRSALHATGSKITCAPLLMRTPRRMSSKRANGAAAGRHLAALQILRRLRAVAGQTAQDVETVLAESPSAAGPFSSPLPRSRFSRASAVHQLTPYRPRRSGSGSGTPPLLVAEIPIQTESCIARDPSSTQHACLENQGGSPPGRLAISSVVASSPDPVLPQCPNSPGTEQERCMQDPVSAVEDIPNETADEEVEQNGTPTRCLDAPRTPSSDIVSDKTSGVVLDASLPAPITAGTPSIPSRPQQSLDPHPSNTPLAKHSEQGRSAPGLSSFSGGATPAFGLPPVTHESESRLAFGLSPFPGGTPPLPSKLAANAAEEMGQWREEVQHMRAELSRSYKSICHLQSVLWESPSARRLLSPATLRRKRSPHRTLGRAKKLPPSPLSRMSMPDESPQLQPRPPSVAKRGLATGVFYLGAQDSGGVVRTISKPTVGTVPFERKMDVAGISGMGTLNGEWLRSRSCGESGVKIPVSNPGETSGQSADPEGIPLRGGPSLSASVRSNGVETAPDLTTYETTPGDAFSRGGQPSSSNGTPWENGASSGGQPRRTTNAAAGVEVAPSGILGFLHGLFSPVSVGNTGQKTAGPSGQSRERNGGAGSAGVDLGAGREGAAESTRHAAGVSTAEPDTWHDASDEVLPRSILFEHSPNGVSPSSSPRHSIPLEATQTRTSLFQNSPARRRATTPVRSPALSIQAVALPPLTSSYSTTAAALTLPSPLMFSPPRSGHESSPRRNRVLVHRSHNESEKPILQTKPEVWSAPAPPTPFHPASENVPGNTASLEQPKGRTKRAAAARSVSERGLLSSFYRSAGPGSRPLPPVTREVLQQKANSGRESGGNAQFANTPRVVDSTAENVQAKGDSVLNEGRHVKWWDAEEEEDKENGVGGKKPKARSPRYSPKHMSATPSKSILKQGVHVGSRSLAQARDARLRKLQAQAALGPKLSGRALRIKGRYI